MHVAAHVAKERTSHWRYQCVLRSFPTCEIATHELPIIYWTCELHRLVLGPTGRLLNAVNAQADALYVVDS